MAEKSEIEFTIDKNGNIAFEVKGLKGPQCLKETEEIEKALGKVVNREKTSEYYQTDVQQSEHINQSWNQQ